MLNTSLRVKAISIHQYQVQTIPEFNKLILKAQIRKFRITLQALKQWQTQERIKTQLMSKKVC